MTIEFGFSCLQVAGMIQCCNIMARPESTLAHNNLMIIPFDGGYISFKNERKTQISKNISTNDDVVIICVTRRGRIDSKMVCERSVWSELWKLVRNKTGLGSSEAATSGRPLCNTSRVLGKFVLKLLW